MSVPKPSWLQALGRGLRRRCPNCGVGPIFKDWNLMHHQCPECGWVYEETEGDSWGFMYVSTGFITGLFIIGMFIFKPENRWLGVAIVAVLSIVTMMGTQSVRKGFAIALDYLLRRKH